MKDDAKINRLGLVILIIWTLSIFVSMIYNINNISKEQNNLALEHAKNAFAKDLMYRNWVAMHGGVYVFPTKKTPPNPYLSHIKNRDLETTTGEKLTLMNPAYALKQLMENFEGMYGEKGNITSLKLLNPKNNPDEWEAKVLKDFDAKEFIQTYEIYNYKGSEHLRYMKALMIEPSCLKCHAHQGYKVGDVRGGVSITVPMEKYNNDGFIEKKNVVYLHIIILTISYLVGFVIYNRVIKLLKKEEKMKEELKAKKHILEEQTRLASMGEMIGNIAHQWRQPLSIISTGATGILVQKEYDILTDKNLVDTCEMINTNAQYLSKTIDDFRNFIKGDKVKEKFNIKENIDSFLVLVQGSIKNHNIEVKLDIDEKIDTLGFPNELIQCYINIFNNAKDALKNIQNQNRMIFIDVYSENDNIIINFKDNAKGISNDILPKIFEPYFTTKQQSQGTGLGLYMIYNIINTLDGTIKAKNISYKYNNQQYTGAQFTITLPVQL